MAMRPGIPPVILSRRAKIALIVVGVIVVLLVLLVKLSAVLINYLWFGEVGHRGVYGTIFWTRLILFVVFGLLMALIIGGNLVVAYLVRPPFRPMSPEQQNLQHYASMVEPRRKLVLIAVAVIAFLAAGASAQGDWAQWQLFLHGGSFGTTDPQFHLDVSFYAWDYPVYRTLLSFGFTAIVFSLILTVAVHYLSGAIRLQTPGPKITIAARRQLTILVFAFMVFKAAAYWLDRYGLVFSSRSKFTGASYTDVHSLLPAKTILFWITIILALGVLASIWLRSAVLPFIGFVVLVVLSILISGIYPAIVQQVTVKPNASTKEAPYILRNIDATRQAYGIVTRDAKNTAGTVTYRQYAASSNPSSSALTATDATVPNIRILDPNVLSPTFAQQQAQQQNFYGFPAKLDVDRYTVKGKTNDYIVGVRELAAQNLTGQQTNWINQHTNYTHGYGFVAAKASQDVTQSNVYADGNIPPSGTLNSAVPLTQPDVYFGELVSDYAIVGAKGTPREFDGDGAKKVTYHGKGGIALSNPFTKLAFAIHDRETNFLLNDAVNASGARILINRDPRQRVEKVAPFLKADGDPYPIVDQKTGHVVWIVDAYTTINNYPYSERNSLSSLTASSLTNQDRTAGQPNSDVNYIRNSVKATVDAYDGTVHLYQWGSKDPVLNTWKKVFPGLIQKNSAMPSSIREHVRYPEDLFEVQRSVLEQYHVSNPVTFYNVGDKWTVPKDPAAPASDQPPYYVLADPQNTPGTQPQFQLTTPMKVNSKTNLAAYVTVDSDPGPGYGQMTVLTVPRGSVIKGPEQIANNFKSFDVISSYITLQDRAGSTVVDGNLLTLPIGNSFLYVEPLYVQAQANGYPLLRRVLTAYGNKVGFGANLADALSDLQPGHFTGETLGASGSDTGASGTGSTPTTTPSTSASPTGPSSSPTTTPAAGGSGGSTSLPALLTQLNQAYADYQSVAKSGDQVKIATAQTRIDNLVKQIIAAQTPAAKPTK